MAGPNTHREALIAELLGDVGALLDRAEALNASIPAAVDQAAAKVRGAGETAAGGVKGAGEVFMAGFDTRTTEALQSVQKAAREAQSAAKVVDGAAWRFALMTALIGLAAGILGGGMAALAVSHGLLGPTGPKLHIWAFVETFRERNARLNSADTGSRLRRGT